ncbi:hypothetical protein JCM11251_002643 [Rhodosporidiobolus azoricus]
MPPNPLDPSSFTHRFVTVPSGRRFHIIDEAPEHWVGKVEEAPTVLLLHGFPDLWYGWRYQISYLSSRGYRVLCPTQTGYGESSRPAAEAYQTCGSGDELDASLEAYTYRSVAYDMAGVLDAVGAGKVFVIGHDWGGAVAWRFTEYFPERALACISVCTPYFNPSSPSATYEPLSSLTKTKLPNFGYQLFFASETVPAKFDKICGRLLAGMFSTEVRESKIKAGKVDKMPVKEGEFEKFVDGLIDKQEKGELPELPKDEEFRYYNAVFSKSGFATPTNWYRTRRLNFRDDQLARFAERGFPKDIPSLLLPAGEDNALPPSMALSPAMKKAFKGGNLRIEVIEGADHWLLQDRRFRDKVSEKLDSFIQEILSGKWQPEPVKGEAKL